MPEKIRLFEMVASLAVDGPGGGIGRFGIDFCKTLSPEQWEVWLIALWDFGAESEKIGINALNAQGINTLVAARWDEKKPYQSFWRAFLRIRKLCRTHFPQIIHSHSEFGDILALFLKFCSPSLRLTRTVHYGYQYEWRKRPLRRFLLTNFLYPIFFELEIGVAPWIAKNLTNRTLAAFLKKQALYIPNAISIERFNSPPGSLEKKKASWSIPPGASVIGTVGRLTEQKGYQYLIKAAALVTQEIPESLFLVIGVGEELQALQALAQELNVTSRVIFLGSRQDVEELLPCLDLFVSSSLWEGLPTVLLEAIAAGIPIVGTDIPGTKDLIQHRKTGYLVPAGKPDLLARGIIEMLGNLPLRKKLAQASKEILPLFSMLKIAHQYEQCYWEILRKRPAVVPK